MALFFVLESKKSATISPGDSGESKRAVSRTLLASLDLWASKWVPERAFFLGGTSRKEVSVPTIFCYFPAGFYDLRDANRTASCL
ncbi:hypothetical protein NPIL_686271 [Nephila pilipes]|uniref:Uncharacterized protein n=1 Tax=Nephila pilipes TaxID=299642 RepID=A0A8X6QLV8_NEPPI|nr:hypothetical protein NPIL_233621 [Nephila pilipes]GFT93840.1 hypothetical protein NPIL_580241 [Nephila pilipes]GFU30850.1 hypothetical protein NPIL_435431 [Nephila pilipes]GFU32075.1 hypothetical protein NPIL_686271 [Nephila pilipes]